MKKLGVLLVTVLGGWLVLVWSVDRGAGELVERMEGQTGRQQGVVESVEEGESEVELAVDFGEERLVFVEEYVESERVLDLLVRVGKRERLEVQVEEFDFGSLVRAIGEVENGKSRAWIYFVNGVAGEVGADSRGLAPGDVVEWKYVEPEGL